MNETKTLTISEFLKERYADEEQLAQAAAITRVLEDIMSKRAIVDEHAVEEVASLDRETWGKPFLVCRRCRVGERQVVSPCPTLRLLAAPYRRHEDYREEWT